MQLTWHGLNCFRLQGRDATVTMDPPNKKSGLEFARFQSDIVILSSDEVSSGPFSGNPIVIDTPGEYEVKDTFVYGLPWRKEKSTGQSVLYRINMEGVSIGHLGGLDRVIPNNALEILEGCDVLLLPVGNKDLLTAQEAVEVIARIEPRIIIPMDYATKGLKVKRETPAAFIKELGLKAQTVNKLKFSKKDLPTDQRVLYLFEIA